MSIKTRLDRHFVAFSAVAAAGAAVGFVENADAAIVHSGTVNLTIASSTNGLYLNVVTGVINEPGNTGGASVPGWDINPWSSSALSYFNPAAPAGGVYVQRTGGGATANLPFGTLIGPASVYGSSPASTTGSEPHVLSSSSNIIGFRFQNEANANLVHYGWFRVSLDATLQGQPRTLVEFAYDNEAGRGIEAGVIPAPASAALLALGALGLAGRRRK